MRVHTYSVVARDPDTGEMGVAVQSHWFSVGPLVAWAEAGVGAVATQAFVDPAYGPLGLELLRAGRAAPDALRALLAADEGRDVRQVGIVDAAGRAAAHTGARCLGAAGHVVGDGWAVQANMMRSDAVWPAMARALEGRGADLADRLLAALDAAESAGGDVRGRQSAAILVVAARATGRPWIDRRIDLRVEDHPQPLAELRRLLRLRRAYDHMNAHDAALERGDVRAALAELDAARALAPEKLEIAYWHAVALTNLGRHDEAAPIFRQVFDADPSWRELTARLPAAGLLAADVAGRAAQS